MTGAVSLRKPLMVEAIEEAEAVAAAGAGIADPWSEDLEERFTFPHLLLMWRLLLGAVLHRWWWLLVKKEQPLHAHPRFDGASTTLQRIREGAQSWIALHFIYNQYLLDDETASGKTHMSFWYQFRNAQAVRNRRRMARKAIYDALIRIHREREGKQIHLLSIACGSAQAVMEAVGEARRHGVRVRISLLDREADALEYAMGLAVKQGLPMETLHPYHTDIRQLDMVAANIPPIDLIEMVGFLDYRPWAKAITLIARLRALLQPGGYLITAQIAPNAEARFLRVMLNWWMVYRTGPEFRKLLIEAGFPSERVAMDPEYHRIHYLAVCQR